MTGSNAASRLTGAPLRQWLKRRRQSAKSPHHHIDGEGKNVTETAPVATSTDSEPLKASTEEKKGEDAKTEFFSGSEVKKDAKAVQTEPPQKKVEMRLESEERSTMEGRKAPVSMEQPEEATVNHSSQSKTLSSKKEVFDAQTRETRTRAAASKKDDESSSISTTESSKRRTRKRSLLELDTALVASEAWTCASCTLVNKPRARRCIMCNGKPVSSIQRSDESPSETKSSPSKKRKSKAVECKDYDDGSMILEQTSQKSGSPSKKTASKKSAERPKAVTDKERKASSTNNNNPPTGLIVDTSNQTDGMDTGCGDGAEEKGFEQISDRDCDNLREQGDGNLTDEHGQAPSKSCSNCQIHQNKFTNIKDELLIWQGKYDELKDAYDSMYSHFIQSQHDAIAQFRKQQEEALTIFAQLHQSAIEELRQKHESLFEAHMPNPSTLFIPLGIAPAVTPSPKGAPTNLFENRTNRQKTDQNVLEQDYSLAEEPHTKLQSFLLGESTRVSQKRFDSKNIDIREAQTDNSQRGESVPIDNSTTTKTPQREIVEGSGSKQDLSPSSDAGSHPTDKSRSVLSQSVQQSPFQNGTPDHFRQSNEKPSSPDDTRGESPSQTQNLEDPSQALLEFSQDFDNERSPTAFEDRFGQDQDTASKMTLNAAAAHSSLNSTHNSVESKSGLGSNDCGIADTKRQDSSPYLSKSEGPHEKGPTASLFCALVETSNEFSSNPIASSQDSRTTVGDSSFPRSEDIPPADDKPIAGADSPSKPLFGEDREPPKNDAATKGEAGPSWISNAPSRNFNQEMKDARSRKSVDDVSNFAGSRRRSKSTMPPPSTRAPSLWDDLSQQPDYKYQEVVRCKAIRQGLPCRECADCNEFYDVLRRSGDNLANSQSTQQFSRHRSRFTPPSTPQDFCTFISDTTVSLSNQYFLTSFCCLCCRGNGICRRETQGGPRRSEENDFMKIEATITYYVKIKIHRKSKD